MMRVVCGIWKARLPVGVRVGLVAALLSFRANYALAERNHWQPSDFEPLTSLPWERKGATMESVIEALYREPNETIRDELLLAYLRVVPVRQLDRAFDLCLTLEGTETPDRLLGFYLPIWTVRDPEACWKRMREWFRWTYTGASWQAYERWDSEPMKVTDPDAIRASRFRVGPASLLAFPVALENSKQPRKERVRLLKEFADQWFGTFGIWPGSAGESPQESGDRLKGVFHYPANQWRDGVGGGSKGQYDADTEIVIRRGLVANPELALEILKRIAERKFDPAPGQTAERSEGPSMECLMIWAKLNLPAVIRWAESPGLQKRPVFVTLRDEIIPLNARGFLMSRVDADTRERWMAQAITADDPAEYANLLREWAAWEPKPALGAALATRKIDTVEQVVASAVRGPFLTRQHNTGHAALRAIKEMDLSLVTQAIQEGHVVKWTGVMESWREVDVGEAARYGVDFLLRTKFLPRENLIKMLSGESEPTGDGDMLALTFSALRVWATLRPKEMQDWIDAMGDTEMRQALMRLSQNPWRPRPVP